MTHNAEYWITEIEKAGGIARHAQIKGKQDPNYITFQFRTVSDKHPSKDREPEPQREPINKCNQFVESLKKDGWKFFPPKKPVDFFVIPASEGWVTIASAMSFME
jgi:hypothetical protein